MTISSTIRKAGPFIGNDSASTFPFTFKVFDAEEVEVVRLEVATTIETILSLTTDYTVSLNQDQDSNPGGTITLVAGALATGFNLVITSDLANLQPTDLTNQGGFYPEVINDALDRATIQIQQLEEKVDRSAKLPITSAEDADSLVADIVRIADSADNLDTVAENIDDVNTTADDIANINTVAGSISNVNTTATNIANVNTVAGDIAAVNTVAADLNEPVSEIEVVANSITNVNTVGTNISDVNTVGTNIADVSTVADDISNVNTVAGAIANVNITAANIADVITVADDLNEPVSEIETVAGSIANVNTVGNNITNVNTVAANNANVTAVGADIANVNTVAADITNVNTVATNQGDVNTVAANIASVNTAASDIADIIKVADDLNEAVSEIEVCANNITAIDTVGTNIADVNTVATNIANVNTVAGIDGDVSAVSAIAANVTTVANNDANVTTVATDIANVNTTAASIANVNTAATNIADINTVATDIANVNTTATNIADVNAVGGSIADVNTVAGIQADVSTVAGIASDVTVVATNVADITNFADVYQGPKSTPPTLRNDGGALQIGDLYFNTVSNAMFVYASTGWVPAGSSVNGTSRRFRYIATAGQTTFTGSDSNGNTMAYDAGFVDVYLNGVRLDQTDYTATSGTSIVLASGAALNDELNVVAFGTFSVASIDGVDIINGTVSANKLATGAAVSNIGYTPVNKAGDTMTGNLLVENADPAFRVKATGGNEYQFKADTNDAYIRSATAGINAIKFDYSGRVTMPNQPAFVAMFTGGGSNSYNGYIVYPSTAYNIGGHYNSSNGYFTAPVAGMYAFYIHSQANAGSDGSNPTRIHLTKNGFYFPNNSPQTQLRMDTPNTTWDATWILPLSAGDVVRVYVSARSITDDGAYQHFGGYLLG